MKVLHLFIFTLSLALFASAAHADKARPTCLLVGMPDSGTVELCYGTDLGDGWKVARVGMSDSKLQTVEVRIQKQDCRYSAKDDICKPLPVQVVTFDLYPLGKRETPEKAAKRVARTVGGQAPMGGGPGRFVIKQKKRVTTEVLALTAAPRFVAVVTHASGKKGFLSRSVSELFLNTVMVGD